MKLSPNNSHWQQFILSELVHLLAISYFFTFLPMVPEIMSQTSDLKTWSQGLEFPNLTHTLRYSKKSFLSWASCFLGPYSSSPLPLSLCMCKACVSPERQAYMEPSTIHVPRSWDAIIHNLKCFDPISSAYTGVFPLSVLPL